MTSEKKLKRFLFPILIIISMLIFGFLGYLIGYKKTTKDNMIDNNISSVEPVKDIEISSTEVKQKNSSYVVTNNAPSTVLSEDLMYVTKVGIKIPYPKQYSFEVSPLFNFSTIYCMGHTPETSFIEKIDTNGPVKKCIDYLIPNKGSEKIKFGFIDNEEKIEIKTSDMTDWGKIIKCEDWFQGKSYEILNISNQKIYHITSVDGSETYCTINSDYSFKLDRKVLNKVKIDVSKIIFP